MNIHGNLNLNTLAAHHNDNHKLALSLFALEKRVCTAISLFFYVTHVPHAHAGAAMTKHLIPIASETTERKITTPSISIYYVIFIIYYSSAIVFVCLSEKFTHSSVLNCEDSSGSVVCESGGNCIHTYLIYIYISIM